MDNRERASKRNKGVTLVELMIAIALVGIGVLVSVQSYTGISRAIQFSKGRSLAANIAQEKMQILMQKSYFEVLATAFPASLTVGTTIIPYDNVVFTPEAVIEGGVRFIRYTYVQPVMENNATGAIVTVPATTPDTGMRQITETVVWSTDNGSRFLVLKSVLNNPNTVMANTVLTGVVRDSITLTAIPNALVNAAENIGWQDTTNASGNFLINLSPGSFDFQASAPGYYPKIISLTLQAYSTFNQTFDMTRISSGTVQGTAWFDNHPVISQVVASTGPSNNIEYVELYNPTTAPINMGTNAAYSTPNVWTVIFDAANPTNVQERELVYISTYIPVGGFFLITNTGDGLGATSATNCDPITIKNTTVNPDACWRFVGGVSGSGNYNHTLQCNPVTASGCGTAQNAGGFGIGTNGGLPWTGLGNTTKYDAIGWAGNGMTPSSYETSPAVTPSGNGLDHGETFLRRLDTTTAYNTSYGNSYDSDDNLVDFIDYNSPQFAPRTTGTQRSPVTGTPAYGAIVSVIDGLSIPSSATLHGVVGSAFTPPYAQFAVPGVATGTWIVFLDSGTASAEIDGVVMAASAVTLVPNGVTSPNWTEPGAYTTIFTTGGLTGIISGKVSDGNTGLNGITVTANGNTTTTGPTGTYLMRVSTGTYDVTANPSNANPLYASATQPSITTNIGNICANVNFSLSQGGKINGWVSRDGVNPLPGVSVIAIDTNGNARDNEITGSDGRFILTNLSTGPYTVSPILDLKELSSPTTGYAMVTAGFTTWVGTFTVTGALGTVTGTVTSAGQAIKSGVLIVIATGTISVPLPALSTNTLNMSAFYTDTSKEDGTYSVDVRGSSTSAYNVSAFYMYMNGGVPVISTQTTVNIMVNAGQTSPPVNFAW